MKKIVILLLLILVISAVFFIPVTQQKTISVKSSFFNIYKELTNPGSWEKWAPDLKKRLPADSGKVSIKKNTGSFTINYAGLELKVKSGGNSFNIIEHTNSKTINYSYVIIPNKLPDKTLITVYKNINVINYLIGKFKPVSFSDTNIDDFKNFMETDSLYYGCKIFKTRVPGNNLIVIRKIVLSNNKFGAAAKIFNELQQYIKTNHIKQIQPVIAQFIPKGKDSAEVNVGFFIDKEVISNNDIAFTRMPKGGPLYTAKFRGEFIKRQRIYSCLQQYFADHAYQSAILPFETYLDNKLPASDTARVNIQVNFSSYF